MVLRVGWVGRKTRPALGGPFSSLDIAPWRNLGALSKVAGDDDVRLYYMYALVFIRSGVSLSVL